MDDDKEKMAQKYGNWARFMTESEAKSMLNGYGKVMQNNGKKLLLVVTCSLLRLLFPAHSLHFRNLNKMV